MAVGCLGCPGLQLEASQLLDRIPLPWLAIPTTQPWAHTHDLQAPVTLTKQWKKRGGRGWAKRRHATPQPWPTKTTTHWHWTRYVQWPTWVCAKGSCRWPLDGAENHSFNHTLYRKYGVTLYKVIDNKRNRKNLKCEQNSYLPEYC